MKEKKGFTLIELLAVIIILAIIALIATPLILNIMNDARRNAFRRSAEGVLRGSKLTYSNDSLDMNTKDRIYKCINNKCVDKNDEERTLSAESVMGDGEVYILNDGKIAFALSNGTYCATKYFENDKIVVTNGDCSDIELISDTTPPEITSITSRNVKTSLFEVVVSANDERIRGYNFQLKLGNEIIVDYKNDNEIENNSTMDFTGLNADTEYTVNVRVYNKLPNKTGYEELNNMTEGTITVKTNKIGAPELTLIPSTNLYTTVKKVGIKYNGGTGIAGTYEVRKTVDDSVVTGNEYYEEIPSASSYDKLLLIKQDGVYVVAKNADTIGNETSSIHQVVENIDRVNPEIGISYTKNSNSITITVNKINVGSSNIYGYMYSKDDGTTWEEENGNNIYSTNVHTFTGLRQNETYNIKVRAISNANKNASNINEISGYVDVGIGEKMIPITIDGCSAPSLPAASNTWVQARPITITNNAQNGYHIEYATVAEPTDSDFTGAREEDIVDSATGNLTAIIRENGIVTVRATDGANTCNSSTTYIEDYIDNTIPNLSVVANSSSVEYVTLTATVTNNPSGVYRYKFSINDGSSWTGERTSRSYSTSTSGGYKYPRAKIYTNAWYNTASAYRNDATGIVEASGTRVYVSAATNTPTKTPTPTNTPTNTPTPISYTNSCCYQYANQALSSCYEHNNGTDVCSNGMKAAYLDCVNHPGTKQARFPNEGMVTCY